MLKHGREKGETDRTNKLTDKQNKKTIAPEPGNIKNCPCMRQNGPQLA